MIYERFAILGLATGSLYALSALGIVIVSRASGVLNFASGAVGAFGAYLTYDLIGNHGIPSGLALLLGVALGAVLGVFTHFLIMVVLRSSGPLSKLIATLALLTVLEGVVVLIWGPTNLGTPNPILPSTLVTVHGVTISEDRLWLIGISLIAALALKLVYSKTRFGLATAAVAENGQVAAMSGLSAFKVEVVNYAIAGAIAAAAGILLAPILGLDVTSLAIIVIPALAAALVGRFTSFGVTVGAALFIGLMQAEIPQIAFVRNSVDGAWAGLPDAVPVLLIVLVTAVRGRGRLQRGEITSRLPLPGSGIVNVPFFAIAAVAGLVISIFVGGGWASALATTFAISILVLSVIVVTGFAGQLSLAQFAIAGFGLWVTARFESSFNWPFLAAACVGLIAAVGIGLVVALPALRARGVDLAIATLGLALAIQDLVLGNTPLTGGYFGTHVGNATLFGWSINATKHPNRYAALAFVSLLVTSLIVANLRRGRSGRRLLAVRSNERAAASLGVGVYGAKLYAFGVAAAIAGVSGIILGFLNQNVEFSQFNIFGSISAVEYAVVGGLGMVGSAVIGGALSVGGVGSQLLSEFTTSANIEVWVSIVTGVIVILNIGVASDGVAMLLAPIGRRLTGWTSRVREDGRKRVAEPRRHRTQRPLEFRGVTVRFGGVVALSGVSFEVYPGEVLGLIGPNGAGKTTLLDVATGFTKPTEGDLWLGGECINEWSPERRAREGLGRSFQAVELFEELTVRDNLLVAADQKSRRSYATDLVHPGTQPESEAMASVIASFELRDVLHKRPSELSQGQGRLVGIARAMCTEPMLLFLDEPAAGLDGHERLELSRKIRSLVSELGIGVVFVEHDVPLVMSTCDRVVALDSGTLIAQGVPDAVRGDALVIASYLGEEVDLMTSFTEESLGGSAIGGLL